MKLWHGRRRRRTRFASFFLVLRHERRWDPTATSTCWSSCADGIYRRRTAQAIYKSRRGVGFAKDGSVATEKRCPSVRREPITDPSSRPHPGQGDRPCRRVEQPQGRDRIGWPGPEVIPITLENFVIGWQRQAPACRWFGLSAIGQGFGLAAATQMRSVRKTQP